jgi:alginate O-acetyltransferase complex protein AlgI
MHFISFEFVLFAAAFFFLFFFLGRQGQKFLLLLAGYFFCGFHSPWFAAILALSTLGNYLASRLMFSPNLSRRGVMWAGIVFNLLLLGVFKYFDFFSTSLTAAAASVGVRYSPLVLGLVVPIGLSFYTFQAISYLVDLRNGKIKPAPLLDYAVFMSFWPKFVAGPIIRATAFMPQLQRRRTFRWANFYLGLEAIVYGLFLKAVLSDYLVPAVKRVYDAPKAYDGAASLVAALFYTFQMYGDFAGYSLIVIGVARIMGYSVRANFRRPNFAVSFSDFWRRWHISLSKWLGDYIFRNLPLKVARRGATPAPAPESAGPPSRQIGSPKLRKELALSRNQMATLLFSGLWHGAAWTFVTWGFFHGVMLILQRQVGRRIRGLYAHSPTLLKVSIPLQIAFVFTMVAVSRIIFRSPDFSVALQMFHNILAGPYHWGGLEEKASTAIGFLIILSVMTVEAGVEYGLWRRSVARWRLARVAAALLVLMVIMVLGDFGGGRFIYVRF